MELFKKILVVFIAIIVVYFVLIAVVEIVSNSLNPNKSKVPSNGIIKIIPSPILNENPSVKNTNQTKTCNSDIFKCSDGTSVKRTGPNCQFVCPNINR